MTTVTNIRIFKLVSRVNSLAREVESFSNPECTGHQKIQYGTVFGFGLGPPLLFPGLSDTGDMDVNACGSFSYTRCTDPEAGDIMPVYTATLAGIFSFLTTDAVIRGAV